MYQRTVGRTVGSKTVSWVLHGLSGAHHPLNPVIRLCLRHPRKKALERKAPTQGTQTKECVATHRRSPLPVRSPSRNIPDRQGLDKRFVHTQSIQKSDQSQLAFLYIE